MTREEYMNAEDRTAAHRQYYGQFVTDYIRRVVADRIGIAAIVASLDPHFNDIPLHKWDNLDRIIRKGGWSLSDSVCTAKEAARQMKEAQSMRRSIRVYYEDGNTVETWINGTKPEIEAYYVGKAFQFGDTEECPQDKMVKATRVEFLSN